MKILVISGCCLYQNTSANLCHRAYIQGFVELGHTVDLLTFSENNINIDRSILLPNIRNHYKYDGISLYEKLAARNTASVVNETADTDNNTKQTRVSIKSRVINKTKRFVRSLYGIYNPTIVWYRRAKKFTTNEEYDVVVSLSYPQVSHLLAKTLIKKKRVKTKRWIQVWEDPWSIDLNNSDSYKKSLKAESKLLDSADEIIYVSPITLRRQHELFLNNKSKMKWFPLPSYYSDAESTIQNDRNYYGYFGDYSPNIRNLEPFYNVAVSKNLNVDICGSPANLFPSKNKVNIYPRLPLGELKKHEDKANVVVCLFNLGGGQIPGKIYQLAATNKTILAILDGPEDEQKIIRDYFEKYNRFVFCQNNEQSISEAIDKIENNDLGGVSNNPIDYFSVDKVAKTLLGD